MSEPQWHFGDYATIDKKDLFSNEFWKRTVEWDVLLEQIKKIENACQLLDKYVYPSRLFQANIDILEANMYVLDDLFYFLTGARVGNHPNNCSLLQNLYVLRFWNLDRCHEMDLISEELDRIEKHLMLCLKQRPLWEIVDEVVKKSRRADELKSINHDVHHFTLSKDYAYAYAYEAYKESKPNKKAVVNQIVNILNFLNNYQDIFRHFDKNVELVKFGTLLASFRQSEKGKSLVKPWRRDFEGSRDSLIAKMEKDPELGPWVNKYTHLREDEDVIAQLFCDDLGYFERNEESCNTDNWIRILTIAAVLEEYDEHQVMSAEASAKEEDTLLRLSLYIKENLAGKFLESAHTMKTDKEIIALVRQYYDNKMITGASKDLWSVLNDANLYKKTYKNWRDQLNKSIKKEKKKTDKLD